MDRYVCVHGHFYQPPRENPWLDVVERQPSAQPHHDWNARITDECYRPNAASRLVDDEGRNWSVVNNYASMSFDFGPTLLRWMESNAPDVYAAILDADRSSINRFGGHGSAMAQSYHHAILPLCNDRDRATEVTWGIADFERRFGRKPEGMWLPECAVNTPTLETLAESGIKFTILAPTQAAVIRPSAGHRWKSVRGGKIDPSRAYLQKLPSGKSINLFFYDRLVSHAVAFEKLLDSGEQLAQRLMGAMSNRREWPQLVHIATDGESYGHHFRHGNIALADALEHIQSQNLATLINYGLFLERYPPTHEVRIVEDSSWSCEHGVQRWYAHCGCSAAGREDWNQSWREDLRHALDWLRDDLAPRFEQSTRDVLRDPWIARDEYIGVVLDRSPRRLNEFFFQHATRQLSDDEVSRTLMLLEMQRHLLMMYASCAWFFDELSGIETVQAMRYAARALQLAEELFGEGLESQFAQRLESAKSNLPEYVDGRQIYEKQVKT